MAKAKAGTVRDNLNSFHITGAHGVRQAKLRTVYLLSLAQYTVFSAQTTCQSALTPH